MLFAAATFAIALLDPLVKVFPTTLPVSTDFVAEVARGEVASWQVAVRNDSDTSGLRIQASPLISRSGASLGRPQIRAIGYVPVDGTIPQPPKRKLAPVPGPFPDPLLVALPISLKGGETRSYWIDVQVPKTASPGEYTSTARVSLGAPRKTETVTLKLKVYPVTVGKSRLWVTNWYSPPPGDPQQDDSPFWANLAKYARNMAAHRQNVAMVAPLSTVRMDDDGNFDFSVFNRWVEVFRRAGVIGMIEGGHLGGRIGAWESQFQINILERKDGNTTTRGVSSAGAEADSFYSRFLPALVKNLKDHRWLGIYRQHVADEPTDLNAESYAALRGLVKKYAPELRVMDANYTTHLVGSMELWVPEMEYWSKSLDFYRERKAKGDELWFYTCVVPQGEFPNRFMEQPLLEPRLLHWFNFKYGANGYLHWGWNRWGMMGKSPFERTIYDEPNEGFLPAGDCFIVYPGKDDGDLLDSIRWETMRDGIADYELLSMLAEKDLATAMAFANRLITNFTSFVTNPETFRSVRHDLLEELSRSTG